jgi:hypothetical protein
MTVSDIRNFLMADATDSDVDRILQAINLRKEYRQLAVKKYISIGDVVKFQSPNDLLVQYIGDVVKVARKRATVKIISTNISYPKYRVGSLVSVPMEMLHF